MSLNKSDKMPSLDANVVKIAVEMESENPQLKEFNQKIPLTNIIQDLCSGWDLIDPEQYALKFSEKTNQNYVTEKNRNEIKNGSVLRLAFSPSKIAHDILQILHSEGNDDRNERTSALQKLSECSTDITFALEFINKQGLALIISLIERGKCQGAMLTYALASFVELMDHGIVSWDILETPFINMVASYVNNQTSRPQEAKVVKSSLSILESIVLNSSAKYGQVEKEVGFPNLVLRLENQNPIIQQNALSLINALFLKADPSKRKIIASTLCTKQVRNVILQNIIQTSSGEVGSEMAHQLYVMQTLCFGLLEERMNTKMDPQDQDAHEKIKELRKIAFELDTITGGDTNRRQLGPFTKDYKKLGFKYDINPALDFTETPPGMLALDCMVYFARNHVDAYTKVVLENSCRADEHECPFGRSSVELVRLLCNILRIGELPSEQTTTYHQIFFSHDHPFHELYCVCIILLNKTWKEMRATTEDFVKVLSVVREQITRALGSQPANLEKLRQKLSTLTYSEITNLWQQERTSREQWESHARPIVQLKELVTPEIVQLIKKQRLHYMVDGTRFTKYSQRGQRVKDKFWFVRLSQNHKVLHYGDCDDKSVPAIEELPNKLGIVDIKALLTGKDCPHMKDAKNRKSTHQLAFSLTLDSVEMTPLYFVAPDEMVYDYWIDGINALLGNKMTSKEADNDLETLLSMEIKLRLLDAEGVGVDIPQDPPPVPADPPNYEFCYDFK
ncbi:PH domain-like,Pleckstrin homology domain,Armadillo-like helical,ELMO domain,Armadillo-type [Cinara cedri]|uniref:PH domain-like,Pleckstrin homology domain,Armadillo-like helical,ELMO domain,Armadillo-type n=1 Tax=Cinara cedri TaxID=506608 RepID=A0A5E4MMB5_9HEMI|nr:PH domain-like,Pleckstrin homology domain,Armadillo-like helical,ELMO domain,Armadillo-type [Cinara cedri]